VIGAAVIEAGRLLDVVLYALAATIGTTLLFSLAILSLARASERRSRHDRLAVVEVAVAGVCLAGCLAAVAYGIVLLSSK
jgi:hypothetical protein